MTPIPRGLKSGVCVCVCICAPEPMSQAQSIGELKPGWDQAVVVCSLGAEHRELLEMIPSLHCVCVRVCVWKESSSALRKEIKGWGWEDPSLLSSPKV